MVVGLLRLLKDCSGKEAWDDPAGRDYRGSWVLYPASPCLPVIILLASLA